jgi:hypothetical protein
LVRHKVKDIIRAADLRDIRAADLRDELTFTSFRHGGFTEAADADLTDRGAAETTPQFRTIIHNNSGLAQ